MDYQGTGSYSSCYLSLGSDLGIYSREIDLLYLRRFVPSH